jgi:hypothetical protein
MYNIAHRIGTHGIEGYGVTNKYEELNQSKRGLSKSSTTGAMRNKPITDRTSYLK